MPLPGAYLVGEQGGLSAYVRPRRAVHSARVCLKKLQTVRIVDTSVGPEPTVPPYH